MIGQPLAMAGATLCATRFSGKLKGVIPATGPIDVIGGSGVGVLSEDLRAAALAALQISRQRCRAFALSKSWAAVARQFLDNVLTARARLRAA